MAMSYLRNDNPRPAPVRGPYANNVVPLHARSRAEVARPSHLRALESEGVHVLREVAAEFERPVLLFSGGKDSIVLLRLAEKAFRPGRFPFPLMHVDTGDNFPEVIAFRDRIAAQLGERLIVRNVQDSIDSGRLRLKSADQSNAARYLVNCDPSRNIGAGNKSSPEASAMAPAR